MRVSACECVCVRVCRAVQSTPGNRTPTCGWYCGYRWKPWKPLECALLLYTPPRALRKGHTDSVKDAPVGLSPNSNWGREHRRGSGEQGGRGCAGRPPPLPPSTPYKCVRCD
jgi:hypothetical protein